MGRQLLRQPNGRYAIFSSVEDEFILWNATPEEVITHNVTEAAREARIRAEAWVRKAKNSGVKGGPGHDMQQALDAVESVHGCERAAELLDEMGEESPDDGGDYIGEPIVLGRTGRDFGIGRFSDHYGEKCSIQDSSLACQSAIWLGISEDSVLALVPGQGWKDLDIKQMVRKVEPGASNVLVKRRMHLTVGMVRQLITVMQRFVETGSIQEPDTQD